MENPVTDFIVPSHFSELIWWIYGAFSEDAKNLSDEFYGIIWHIPVSQSWPLTEAINISSDRQLIWPLDIITEAIQGLILDPVVIFVGDLVDRVFDADTHFMMNFYESLSIQSFALVTN